MGEDLQRSSEAAAGAEALREMSARLGYRAMKAADRGRNGECRKFTAAKEIVDEEARLLLPDTETVCKTARYFKNPVGAWIGKVIGAGWQVSSRSFEKTEQVIQAVIGVHLHDALCRCPRCEERRSDDIDIVEMRRRNKGFWGGIGRTEQGQEKKKMVSAAADAVVQDAPGKTAFIKLKFGGIPWGACLLTEKAGEVRLENVSMAEFDQAPALPREEKNEKEI